MKTRVLLIGEAVDTRRVLDGAFQQTPDLDLIGWTPNGAVGLRQIQQRRPHVVLLDLRTPDQESLETLETLRLLYSDLPVIALRSSHPESVRIASEALSKGANDVAMKPGRASESEIQRQLDRELFPKIRALAPSRDAIPERLPERLPERIPDRPDDPNSPASLRASLDLSSASEPLAASKSQSPWSRRRALPEILLIGASTGGPAALTQLIGQLPAHFPLPILIVQHMPANFTGLLAERLNTLTPLAVEEAKDHESMKPGMVRVAPGDRHLELRGDPERGYMTRLTDGPPENACRPSVDVLFRTAAKAAGERAMGLVLTGMGKDGLAGAELLSAQGATLWVQDQGSSVVWGMPGYISRRGLADQELPLAEIPEALSRHLRGLRLRALTSAAKQPKTP